MRAKPKATAAGAMIATKFLRDLAAFASVSIRLDEIKTCVNAEPSQRIGYPETKAGSCRRRSLRSVNSASVTLPIASTWSTLLPSLTWNENGILVPPTFMIAWPASEGVDGGRALPILNVNVLPVWDTKRSNGSLRCRLRLCFCASESRGMRSGLTSGKRAGLEHVHAQKRSCEFFELTRFFGEVGGRSVGEILSVDG